MRFVEQNLKTLAERHPHRRCDLTGISEADAYLAVYVDSDDFHPQLHVKPFDDDTAAWEFLSSLDDHRFFVEGVVYLHADPRVAFTRPRRVLTAGQAVALHVGLNDM